MKFHLQSLSLDLRHATETIVFSDITYFWGQMGAGKSSIARLIDYCLGGAIQLSPALQAEFVSATLTVELERSTLTIERQRDGANVFASWTVGDEVQSVIVPARAAAGELIPLTGVETLSDLIFWLSGVQPPRVRKSKLKDDSKTVRLSVRDLLWYCYLDQDNIDSAFFHLEEDAEFYLRLKSRDVIRYVIGYRMVYALKAGELSETQIILIDKEYLPPDPALGLDIRSRHMQPDSTEHEPLIRYYRGK